MVVPAYAGLYRSCIVATENTPSSPRIRGVVSATDHDAVRAAE